MIDFDLLAKSSGYSFSNLKADTYYELVKYTKTAKNGDLIFASYTKSKRIYVINDGKRILISKQNLERTK